MKIDIKKDYLRVIPQFTIRPNIISLIAEENHKNFPKGSLVMQVSRDAVYLMHKPYTCELRHTKVKGVVKITPKIVLKGEYIG